LTGCRVPLRRPRPGIAVACVAYTITVLVGLARVRIPVAVVLDGHAVTVGVAVAGVPMWVLAISMVAFACGGGGGDRMGGNEDAGLASFVRAALRWLTRGDEP